MSIWIEIRRLSNQLRTQGLYLTFLAAADKLWRWLTGQPVWRFSRITPSILLGGQPARGVWAKLSRAGVTGVINMRDEYDYHAELGSLPLDYLYLPTVDNTAPTIEQLVSGTAFIEQQVERGGRVYIHCWEGLGRGPSMVAAYLVQQGKTPGEAWATIRAVRPFIRPNETQKQRLDEFAAYIGQPREATFL
ncbi:MAG: dual specificity protein phosphatase family protein [Anaerolineae bacterium]|nr:dual specificity protein phosphatase family protein [Anaerolineae bacterium]